jgi:ATP-binding cassette subfamily B protein RaxB
MIAHYHGFKMDFEHYRREIYISNEGTSFYDLANVAEKLNLESEAFQVSIDDLKELTFPCITNVFGSHFIVIEKISKHFVYIIDPASGRKKIPRLLLSNWVSSTTIYALEFKKANSFLPIDLRSKNTIFSFIKQVENIKSEYLLSFAFAIIAHIAILASPFYVQLSIDDVIVNSDKELLVLLFTAFLFIYLFDAIAQFSKENLIINLQNQVKKGFSSNLMTRLLNLPIEFFHSRSSGAISHQFESLEKITTVICRTIPIVITDGLLSIITLGLMFVYSAQLTLIVLGLVFLYLLLKIASLKVFSHLLTVHLDNQGKEKSSLIDSVNHINLIKNNNLFYYRNQDYKNFLRKRLTSELDIDKWRNNFSFLSNLIQHFDTLIIVYIGVALILEGAFTVGMLYAFIFFKNQFVGSIIKFFDEVLEILLIKTDMQYLQDIIETETESQRDKDGAVIAKTIVNKSQSFICALTDKIEFKRLSFQYPKSDNFVFSDFSYTLQADQSLCIMGQSGSGKSTLLSILIGLYKPKKDQVTINDVDINLIPLHYLRENISMLDTNDSFFNENIISNITLSEGNQDVKKVISILKGLELYDYIINEVKGGLYGMIGAISHRFSTGQKQRLRLARAIYKSSSLLLLDEPTSSLDRKTEEKVIVYLKSLEKRIIIVTHKKEVASYFENVLNL